MIRSPWLFAASLMVFAGFAQAATFRIDSNVPSDQERMLTLTFETLRGLPAAQVDAATLKLLDLPAWSGADLEKWLAARVQAITGESKLVDRLFVARAFYLYPNFNTLPDLETPTRTPKPGESGQGKVVTVMSNVGGAVYLLGKSKRMLVGFTLSDGTPMVFTSPRTGLIQIGEGLFLPRLQIDPANLEAKSNTLNRLGVFFHEARHSDGNGKSLAFAHAVCPEGHDFAGYSACDYNLNGPYTVGARMLKQMTEGCAECSVAEREKMRLRYLDSFNRIIKTRPAGPAKDWDSRPEGKRQ
jgi:hypothetical protein